MWFATSVDRGHAMDRGGANSPGLAWTPTAIGIAALILATIWLYRETALGLVTLWGQSETFAHLQHLTRDLTVGGPGSRRGRRGRVHGRAGVFLLAVLTHVFTPSSPSRS